MRLTSILLALALPLSACGGAPAAPADPTSAPPAPSGPPLAFSYETLAGKPLSTETVAGRITVIGFITTYDTPSLAEASFVTNLSRRHAPRLNVALLVLEAPENKPIVEAFVSKLGISDPVALADAETIAGRGPFAGLHHVPSVIILDRTGHEVWRHLGLAQENEIEQAVRRVEQTEQSAR